MHMADIVIEQAIYRSPGAGGFHCLARSPGFLEEWLPSAERLCAGFGERPRGMACPACLFAQPFGKRHVAIVQIVDQGVDEAGRPSGLAFHFLVLTDSDYVELGGDPFVIADRFPIPWTARGDLPALSWPGALPAPRTLEQIQNVLQRPKDGPNLLGGSQVLVDGGRLVFERPVPDTELMRDLWTLLPTSTRCELWPASFAFSNDLGFDALVTPSAEWDRASAYVRGEQAGDYPQGHYELHLQIAAESGNQGELDALLARRSRREIWRMGLLLLGVCIIVAVLANVLVPPPAPINRVPEPAKPKLPATNHGMDRRDG